MNPQLFTAALTCVLLLMNSNSAAQPNPTPSDPYLWLEAVDSEEALAWVAIQNERSEKRLEGDPLFDEVYSKSLDILNSDERIAYPGIRGDYAYNFWQDAQNERGLLRRSPLTAYLAGAPEWETVLDMDKLAANEEVKWVYKGASWLEPDYDRCILHLSPGGGDAVVAREFDLRTLKFVEHGFNLPQAKMRLTWADHDTLYVGTDFGDGSLTDSGYPRVIKKWIRGTPLEAAQTVFEGERSDVAVSSSVRRRPEGETRFFHRSKTFYYGETYVLENGKLLKLDVPEDSDLIGPYRGQILIELKSDWSVEGRSYRQGAVLAADFEALKQGHYELLELIAPDKQATTAAVHLTRDFVLVNRLEDISNALYEYRFEDGAWTHRRVETPELGTFSLSNTRHESNDYFLTFTNFLTPTTLFYAAEGQPLKPVASLPSFFDSSQYTVSQYKAPSADGTLIPYFLVHRKDLALNGSNPTLLYGYGGFEVALTPNYNPTMALSWLEKGGVYALANIRGGGEYGARWHRAALKEKRQRAFDDFIGVAEDLIMRGVTTPERLGVSGGSNGGLLVGVALTQRPELFGAVVCAVPLLDMQRYHKLLAGASWVAEYGDPDKPEEWAYISEYSPYQNLGTRSAYPEAFFFTSTRDDRVHPGHARKMVARLNELGHATLYYENVEGEHAGSSTNAQTAKRIALTYTYLHQKLNTEK